MEIETTFSSKKKPKNSSERIERFNGYKTRIGQIEKGGNTLYLNVCGYVTHTEELDLPRHFSRLKERLSHIIKDSGLQLLPDLNRKLPFILSTECSEFRTKDKWSFFQIETTYFFDRKINIDDVMIELELICYVIVDYLQDDVPLLSFNSRK